MRRPTVLAAALCAGLLSPPALAVEIVPQQIAEHVWFVRDPQARQLGFTLLVAAGYYEEWNEGCTGIAHYLEHVVLLGRTAERPDTAVKLFGDAYTNGFTGPRVTGYVHRVPIRPGLDATAELDKLFGFYVQRLKDLSVSPAEAERERRVVGQEYDLNFAASPLARAFTRFNRALYPDSPFGVCNIGTRETIAAYTAQAAHAFEQRWYTRGNINVVLTGDLDPAALAPVAAAAMQAIEDRPLPDRRWLNVPPVRTERVSLSESDPEVTHVTAAYAKLVSVPAGDYLRGEAALGLLQAFLSSSLPDSPRRALVEADEPVADQVGVSVSSAAPGLARISVTATPADGVTPEAFFARVEAYLADLPRAVTPAAVARLKQRSLDSWRGQMEKPEAVAQAFTGWVADRRPPDEFTRWPAILSATPPEEVAALAAALTGPGRVVTDVIAPGPKAEIR